MGKVVNKIHPDKGWAWAILLAGFFCSITFDGIIFSFGMFYLEFLDYFRAGRSLTSVIGSVISGIYAIIGPVASMLEHKVGCRRLTMIGAVISSTGFGLCIMSPNIQVMIVTYGLMGGIGFGFMYHCVYVMIGHYFEKRRAFATGIVSCGSSVGTFIFAPLSVGLIEHYGWKGAVLILSGLVLNGAVCGAVFRPVNGAQRVTSQGTEQTPQEPEMNQETKKKPKLVHFSLLKNPSFLVFGLSSFLCMIGFFVPFIYLPDFAHRHGIEKQKCAFLLSIIGITNTIGRIICGYLSDKPWVDTLKMYNAALILGGAATVCCAWLHTYALLAMYAAIFGVCIAVYVSLCAIILVEFLGLEKLSSSFGFLNMFRGIATFMGTPLAGLFFDSTGSYEVAFYVAGAAITAAGVICLPLRFLWRCEGARAAINQYEKETALEGEIEKRSQIEIGKDILYLPSENCDSDISKTQLNRRCIEESSLSSV